MFVPHTLFVYPNSLDSKDALFLAQPPTIQLVIRYNPQKTHSHTRRQTASYQENNLPWLNRRAVFFAPNGDAVCDEAAKNLREPVETEPDGCARALLGFCVPLRGEEGEAGGYGCFEDAE